MLVRDRLHDMVERNNGYLLNRDINRLLAYAVLLGVGIGAEGQTPVRAYVGTERGRA